MQDHDSPAGASQASDDVHARSAERGGAESIGAAFATLIEDGQTLIEAEIAYRKAQAAYGLAEARAIAVLLLLGLAFGFFTLMAVVVGLLIALATHVGVWGALGLVGTGLAALAGLSLLLALRRIKAAKTALQAGSETR
ncbi:MAG: phage holin family protein [Novosphingobium sp.]